NSAALTHCAASGQGQNRTADTRIFSPLLYQLSYLAPKCEWDYRREARRNQVDAASTCPSWLLGVSRDTFSRMPHPDLPNLTVLAHPLIQHKLTILRDRRTSTRDFKQLVNEIAMLMAYEVTQDLPLESVEIDTPLEPMRAVQVAGKKLTLVPILRAGLGMVEGISQLIPSARVG